MSIRTAKSAISAPVPDRCSRNVVESHLLESMETTSRRRQESPMVSWREARISKRASPDVSSTMRPRSSVGASARRGVLDDAPFQRIAIVSAGASAARGANRMSGIVVLPPRSPRRPSIRNPSAERASRPSWSDSSPRGPIPDAARRVAPVVQARYQDPSAALVVESPVERRLTTTPCRGLPDRSVATPWIFPARDGCRAATSTTVAREGNERIDGSLGTRVAGLAPPDGRPDPEAPTWRKPRAPSRDPACRLLH